MATTFPNIQPAYYTVKNSAPKVRSIQFGSGYEQRARFGINQNPKSFRLTFNVSETQAEQIEEFLDARGGVESFNFTGPNESTPILCICREWSKTIVFVHRARITATFEEVEN